MYRAALTLRAGPSRLGLALDPVFEGLAPRIAPIFAGYTAEAAPGDALLVIEPWKADPDLALDHLQPQVLKKAGQPWPGQGRAARLSALAVREGFKPEGLAMLGHQGGVLLYDPCRGPGRMKILIGGPRGDMITSIYGLTQAFLAVCLARSGSAFVHSAGLEREGRAYLFIGPSGAGKTTLSENWPWGGILSDDAPILQANQQGFRVWGSPYTQTLAGAWSRERRARTSARLGGLFFLNKQLAPGEKKQLDPKRALAGLLDQTLGFGYLGSGQRAAWFKAMHTLTRGLEACECNPGLAAQGLERIFSAIPG